MYLFIYVGRALHCHKNIDITDMMHSDESFPLELYKCFVYQERPGRYDKEWLEWYLSPPLFICLLCTDCLCLLWTCARCCTVTIITTSNLSLVQSVICDPTILNISSQFFSWHFFSMTLWTKVSFNWYTGCKDVRRMMQCCPITKSVAFLSAVFCPVTLFVAVAESRLSVRISANFSQDGEICSSSSRRMDKQLAHTEIAERGAVGYVKVQWLYSLCLSVVLCNTV